jgi:hypothetical protein
MAEALDATAPKGAVTRFLASAPPWVFALYGGLSSFAVYFAMFGYRKPFTAAAFSHPDGWPFAFDFKIALVIAQVAGYATAKFIGVKVISEMPGGRRAMSILTLIFGAEMALLLFGTLPTVIGPMAMYLNGLCLGMIWGLVFGFLEGRRLTEVLGAMLCASFILSSGVAKSVGKMLLLSSIDEKWMPFVSGLVFAPLMLIAVLALAQLPPPSPADEAERVRRAPMNRQDRIALFAAHAPALILLIAVYVILTALRDFRDNFSAEIWAELGFKNAAGIFTLSELPVAAIVLVGLAALMGVKDNRRAVGFNIGFVALGFALLGASTLAYQLHVLSPVWWMILAGAGLYMGYTPFNAMLFDRMIAATGKVGTAGFLIYVADSFGYIGSISLLLVKSFAQLDVAWGQFLAVGAYVACGLGLAGLFLANRFLRTL